MADNAKEKVLPPFTAFRFLVELDVPGMTNPICSAAFSECDGLEISMEHKTIREGGNNNRPIHLIGPVSYGQLTLKRGMTETFDLWEWFDLVLQDGKGWLRADGEVVMLSSQRSPEREHVRFVLTRCLPIKLKAPTLNAQDGQIAIEEMQIAYETLHFKRGT